jgi:hypothetical protein
LFMKANIKFTAKINAMKIPFLKMNFFFFLLSRKEAHKM